MTHDFHDKTVKCCAVTDNSEFFFSCQISLQSGAALQPRDDVMLHLSIRPQENAIVRNHFKNQVWGAEERHGGSPVQPHQSFEVSIVAEHSQYRISINGIHFCTFAHRLPLNLVQYVSISGTCSITHIITDGSGRPGHCVPPVQGRPYPVTPGFPTHHHPPAPPPMPPMAPTAPPPYPGIKIIEVIKIIDIDRNSSQAITRDIIIQRLTRYLKLNFKIN